MSIATIERKIAMLAQTEIKIAKWFLPASLFVLLAGIGAEIYSPTALSFIAYHKIEQKLEHCWQSVRQASDIVTIHKKITGYGLAMHRERVTPSGVREEYRLPLNILDTFSDEGFYFDVIQSRDSVYVESAWKIQSRKSLPLFSESSKQMRRSTRKRQFGFSLVVFLLYVASVAFVCIIGPKIIVLLGAKAGQVDKGMQAVTGVIMGICVFVALGCLFFMFFDAMSSMRNLPEQRALLMS